MTTRVVIESGEDSNPEQELVVSVVNGLPVGDAKPEQVLRPGDKVEYWLHTGGQIAMTERPRPEEEAGSARA